LKQPSVVHLTLRVLQKVKHVYSFFDFQARVPDSFSFEPCVMLPEGKNCKCLDLKCGVDSTNGHRQLIKEANPEVTETLSFNVSGRQVPCPTPEGYITKKHNSGLVAAACMHLALLYLLPCNPPQVLPLFSFSHIHVSIAPRIRGRLAACSERVVYEWLRYGVEPKTCTVVFGLCTLLVCCVVYNL
jgi:hypothetical protein